MDSAPTASRPAAIAVGLLCAVGFLGCVAMDARADPGSLGVRVEPSPGSFYAVTGLVLAALAAVLLWRRDARRFGWALAVLAVLWTLDGLAQSFVRVGLTEDAALPGMGLVLWFLLGLAAFLPVGIVAILLLFPDGRLDVGPWRPVGRVALGCLVASAAVFTLAPPPGDIVARLPTGVQAGPFGLVDGVGVLAGLVPVARVVGVAAFVVALAVVAARYVRSEGLERDRMRWLLWGVLVMVLVSGVALIVQHPAVTAATTLLLMVVPAAAMTVAVAHPTVVPVDELLGTTMVYGLLSAVIVGADLAVLAVLTALLDDRLQSAQVVVIVLLISVLLYNPLRARFERTARRLVVGDRNDPYDVMADLAVSLETADDGPGQLATVAGSVARAFGVGYVSVQVERSRGERLTASYGTPPAELRVLPITYRDTEIGRLVLPGRGIRSRLSRRDERLLGDLVRQAAAAARATRLADDLQESREKLVVAREEERRRIRRDLHDGLGPALGGVVFRLETAILLDRSGGPGLRGHLEATRDEVREVVSDVRRLVHGLRPPALDDRGLVGAVEQHADTLRGHGMTVTVSAHDLVAPTAATEVAALRIAAEAMSNVARHSGARHCDVVLRGCGDDLVVEVTDDGCGIAADAEVGVGLLALRERAGEIGGHSEVRTRAEGGTVVRASLPQRRHT